MIEVKNVVKTFDGFAALNDATLSVPTGSRLRTGRAQRRGQVHHHPPPHRHFPRRTAAPCGIGGEDVWENAALKAKIAAIPDDWYYFTSAGIRDMMRFYQGFYPNFSTERYEKLREVFRSGRKAAYPPAFTRVCRSRRPSGWPCAAMPDYLILDEPVDGLDPVMRRQVWSPGAGRCGRAGHHGAGIQPQPAGAGGRVRPRGHHGPRPGAAGAEPGPAAGQHGEAAGGVSRTA